MTMTAENEFRHHWPAVMACFWVAVFSWGFCFYGQAVYLAALREATGWSTSLISGATTLCYLTGAGFMAFVPQWIARLGPRRVLGGGVIVLGLGTIGLGHATTPWHLFTASLVMALGWSCTSVAAIPVSLSPWFDRRRALAISLALNGASVGGFTVAPLMVHLLEDRALGIAVTEAVMAGWLVVLPWIAWGLRRPPLVSPLPPGVATGPTSRSRLLRDRHFWSVASPFALATAAQVGFVVHMVAFLLPVLGTAWTSTSVSAVSVTAMLGRVSLGSVIDRLPCRPVSAVSFASQAGGLALMLVMPASPPALFAGCVLFGVSVGNVITLPAMIARAEFPAASFGVVIGLNGAIGQLTLAVVPVSFGLLHDAAGGYTPVLIVCIVLQAVAVRLVLRRSVPLPA